MSINAYVGLPRSGKSYGVMAHVIIPALRVGRVVVTNIPLVLERVYELFPDAKIIQFKEADVTGPAWWNENVPAGATCIIDECWNFDGMQQGVKMSSVDENLLDFFKMHGHKVGADGKTTEIVLVTQDLGDVASWLRKLVAKTYYSEKLDAVGADRRYRVDVYKGGVTGENPPKRKIINQIFGTYQEKYYQCYKSASRSETGNVGDEKSSDKRATVWARGSIRYGTPALIAVLALAGYTLYSSVQSLAGVKDDEPTPAPATAHAVPAGAVAPAAVSVAASPAIAAPAAAQAVPPAPPPIVESTRWRLVAVMERGDGDIYIAASNGTSTRRLAVEDCDLEAIDPTCIVGGELVAAWTGNAAGVWSHQGAGGQAIAGLMPAPIESLPASGASGP